MQNSKKLLFWLAGGLGLALTLIPSMLVFSGQMGLERHQLLMAIGMVLWFAAAPYLVKKEAS